MLGEQGNDGINGGGGSNDTGVGGEGDNAINANVENTPTVFALTAELMSRLDGV